MEASWYERQSDGKVFCTLCPNACVISPGKVGSCNVRRNENGVLVSLNYAQVTSVGLDPIEKKPLYHFYPGTKILSLGTWGCNFHCEFCQNWQISQTRPPTQNLSPAETCALAGRDGSIGVAYTYNEPTIWFEYVRDTAALVRQAGLKNVLVTNGFINAKPLEELLKVVDALNIDIKSMSDAFYRKLTGGRLKPVLETAIRAAERAHVEVTYLIIPTMNDRREDFEAFGQWVAQNLGQETPCHLSAYMTRYRLKIGPTPVELMSEAREVVGKYLKHVYLGNVPGALGQDTDCASCGALLIARRGYEVKVAALNGDNCTRCGQKLNGVF